MVQSSYENIHRRTLIRFFNPNFSVAIEFVADSEKHTMKGT